MEWKLILWLISFMSFWGYALWYVIKWGVPKSWSDTFYRLNENYKSKTKGYLLTGALWGMAFPMLPIALDSGNYLMFPVIAAIILIGAAPAFKSDKLEYWVHMTGSYISVLFGALAFGVSYHLWWVTILLILIIALAQFVLKPKWKTTFIESIVIASGHSIVLIVNILLNSCTV